MNHSKKYFELNNNHINLGIISDQIDKKIENYKKEMQKLKKILYNLKKGNFVFEAELEIIPAFENGGENQIINITGETGNSIFDTVNKAINQLSNSSIVKDGDTIRKHFFVKLPNKTRYKID